MTARRTAVLPRIAAAGLLGLIAAIAPTPAAAVPRGVSYSAPNVHCRVTDGRLPEISGLVAVPGAVFAINDKAPALIYRLDERCRVVSSLTLGVRVRDTEDLAVGPDGSLWVGDIGGNNFSRHTVSLYRRMPKGGIYHYQLQYPDGAHDAEAMLISPARQLLVVTKRRDGRSRVYAAQMPLAAVTRLTYVTQMDIGAMRPNGASSAAVTGAAVAPGGAHFVLRTYSTAYEWDSPGGDLVQALRSRAPRVIPLAPTRQGEAITYSADGSNLLTGTELLPAPVHRVTISGR